MEQQVWEVVGGASKGGIVVRAGQDVTSEEVPERLATGAFVKQLELDGERLHFQRLAGNGPDSGWVSIKFRASELLVKTDKEVARDEDHGNSFFGQSSWLFHIVGGSKGGVVVRMGKETSSLQLQDRLSNSATVRALRLEDDRLRYELVEGTGPLTGWISTYVKGKFLAIPLTVKSLQAIPAEVDALKACEPVVGRKLRILAIHGAPANEDFMSFQTAQLRFRLGKDVADWIIPTGIWPWEPLAVKTTPDYETYTRERTEFEKRLAKDSPFMCWIPLIENEDFEKARKGQFRADMERANKSRDHIKELITASLPIDVVVTFSQSAPLMTLVMKQFRLEGKTCPWRMNVFFAAPGIYPTESVFDAPIAIPTIMAWGALDPWKPSMATWSKIFTNVKYLDYADAHEFPLTEPQATEVYGKIVNDIRRHCLPSEDS